MFNNSNLYGSEWLALVFGNRNKNYGAYVLRSQSSSILLKSLLIAASLFVLLFVGPMIYHQLHPDKVAVVNREIQIQIADPIYELKKEELKKEEPAVKAEPIKDKVKTVNMTANIKVVDHPIDDTPPPTMEQLKDAVIGTTTQDGVIAPLNMAPVTTDGGGGTATEGVVDNTVYSTAGVEVYPEFPGGMAAWAKFIQRNLKYPSIAQESGVQGKVYLSFVVEKDGSITDVSVLKGIGAGCDEEAIRVIKKSPRWKAGIQNKQTVRVRYSMPISYTLTQ